MPHHSPWQGVFRVSTPLAHAKTAEPEYSGVLQGMVSKDPAVNVPADVSRWLSVKKFGSSPALPKEHGASAVGQRGDQHGTAGQVRGQVYCTSQMTQVLACFTRHRTPTLARRSIEAEDAPGALEGHGTRILQRLAIESYSGPRKDCPLRGASNAVVCKEVWVVPSVAIRAGGLCRLGGGAYSKARWGRLGASCGQCRAEEAANKGRAAAPAPTQP